MFAGRRGSLGWRFFGALLVGAVAVLGSAIPASAGPPSPTLRINDVVWTEGNSGTTNATFTVTLANPKTSATVSYATDDGTALQPGDYTTSTGSLSLSRSNRNQTLTVPVVGDTIDESNETFQVNLSNASGATIADGQGVGTITDNDAPPSLSLDDVTAPEGGAPSTASFTVSLSALSGKTITVSYATADGSATQPDDYASAAGTLTIPAGSPSGQVDVTVAVDTTDEPDETFSLDLSSPVNATISDGQGVGTITDDDSPPTVSIADASAFEGDSGTPPASFDVALSEPSGFSVTVDYSSSDGSATEPDDYAAASGTVTFAPGEASQAVDVDVVGDTISEGDHSFVVDLSSPVNVTVADGQATGTIVDDDGSVTLSVADVSVLEGTGGTTTGSFLVSLSAPRGQTVTVDYATSDGSATQPGDYASASGTVTFAPGDTSEAVDVQIEGDGTDEPGEDFTVTLSNATEATIADAGAIGTITDDDKTPTSITVKANKTKRFVTGKGSLTGATSGMKVTVTLLRKKGARFVKVSKRTVTVGTPVAGVAPYSARFKRPKTEGTYQLKAAFLGDADHASSQATKSFGL